jgi:putative FmdB family regulatory protein|tara:strand:- start:112 stop:450 length:339 start_codon:yes stop_codon:yes gene_type:complete
VPIYEYKCDKCNHQFEILQKVNDEPAKTCPKCNADRLRKLVSAAAFKLKGTGWYETDFKNKKQEIDKKADKKNKNEPKKTMKGKTAESAPNSKDSSDKSKESTKTSAKKSSS